MGESTTSIYDSPDPIPMAYVEERESLLDSSALEMSSSPSVPPHPSNDSAVSDIEPVPVIPTEADAPEKDRVVGAGVASGVLGLLLGGPILGVVLGFGAAYACQQQGAAGDTARAVGDVALVAKEKAIEIDRQHNVVHKSKVLAKQSWEKAKELDQKHRILERTKNFCVFCWIETVAFIERHKLIERGIDAIGKGIYWAAEKITQGTPPQRPDEEQQSTDRNNNNM